MSWWKMFCIDNAKRKSAVELLQESKAFYVKSEKVLDTKQELKHTEHLQVSSNPNIELLLKAPKNNNTNPTYNSNNIVVGDTKPPLPAPRRSPSNASNCNEARRKSVEQPHVNGIAHAISTRPRSKTQPETILRSDALTNGKLDYRRNHGSDSLQKMLRGLLDHADSRENVQHKEETAIRSGDAILKPRQQQDCNYSIHKSMPDLSPTKLGIGRSPKARSSRATSPTPTNTTITETSTSGSLSLLVHKSTDLKRSHSHNTSDYVSCSPSTKEDGIKMGDLSCVQENEVDEGESKRRPILRSKSDISHRFSKCTTEFLDTREQIGCKSEGDLERSKGNGFFNSMGLEVHTLRTILSPPPLSNSPVYFSSSSSIDSSKRGRDGSESSPPTVRRTPNSTGGLNSKDLMHHGHAETSIVERNARVIKWLFNCRKANEVTVKS